jgi:hypothetical protein
MSFLKEGPAHSGPFGYREHTLGAALRQGHVESRVESGKEDSMEFLKELRNLSIANGPKFDPYASSAEDARQFVEKEAESQLTHWAEMMRKSALRGECEYIARIGLVGDHSTPLFEKLFLTFLKRCGFSYTGGFVSFFTEDREEFKQERIIIVKW